MGQKRNRVFLSTPITNGINQDTGCFNMKLAVQINMVKEKITRRGFEVFLAIEEEKWGKEIAVPEDCTPRDYQNMKNCNHVVVYLTHCFSEGTLVEIGWASALGKPITIICPKEMHMSPLLKGLNRTGDNRIYYIQIQNAEELETVLNIRLK